MAIAVLLLHFKLSFLILLLLFILLIFQTLAHLAITYALSSKQILPLHTDIEL